MTEPVDVTETRASYDKVAADYAEIVKDLLAETPFDRALLGNFAEQVSGEVADVGCGPGRVTAYLESLGVEAFGIDLSPEMVATARRMYPGLRFEVGSMAALDLPDGSLGGLVAYYSLIHTPPERLPVVFAEFARVMAPGGLLLAAFQAGDERKRLEHGYGHDIGLDVYRLSPDRIVGGLEEAGFAEVWRAVRQPNFEFEKNPQAYVMLRRDGGAENPQPRSYPQARFRVD